MNHLDVLVSARRASVAEAKRNTPTRQLIQLVEARAGRRDFLEALKRGGGPLAPAIIAEFKRRSPSAGEFAPAADPASSAAAYERGGASAISVVTEPSGFGGSLDDLRAARAATTLPVLCKDFIVDAYQIWQAAAAEADAILLIASVLDQLQLRGYIALAMALGMSPLVEVRDSDEARRAVGIGAKLLGVNNRDLQSFTVDIATAARVASEIPAGVFVVAESGYGDRAAVAGCVDANIGAVLVGEALMRAADPASLLRTLRGAA